MARPWICELRGVFQLKGGFLGKCPISVKSFSKLMYVASTPSTGLIYLMLFVHENPVFVTPPPVIF